MVQLLNIQGQQPPEMLNIQGQQPPDPPPQQDFEAPQVNVCVVDPDMYLAPDVDPKEHYNLPQGDNPVHDIDMTSASTTSTCSTPYYQTTNEFTQTNFIHSHSDPTCTTMNLSEDSPKDYDLNMSQPSPQNDLSLSQTPYIQECQMNTFVTQPFISQPLSCDSCQSTSSTTEISIGLLDNTNFLQQTENLLQQTDNFNQNMLSNDVQSLTDNAPLKDVRWNLDNSQTHYNSDMSISDTSTTDQQQDTMDFVDRVKRERRDSESSSSSATSGETFSSAYLDTVSSVASTDFLLKLPESDEETAESEMTETVKNIYFKKVSSSSLEISDADVDSVKEEVYVQVEADDCDQPLLEQCNSCDSRRHSETYHEEETELDQTERGEGSTLDDFVTHQLIPITENEIIAFAVEEVTPTTYTKITDNLIVADESFLLESQTNLYESDIGKHGRRSTTMQNLHERLSFLDLTEVSKVGKACQKALIYLKDDMAFGSVASLNTAANKDFDKDPTQGLSLIGDGKDLNVIPSARHTRNLVALSICITLLYIAIGSVRNLQSSINHEGGVGVISMAAVYVGYMVGSIFSVSVVQNFQPRSCIIINLIPNLLYIAANIYPTLWLMLPISLIQGVSSAIVWNAMSTYVTCLARGRAQKKNEGFEAVSGRFFGLLLLIFQSNMIIGNLISSLVLMFGSSSKSIHEPIVNMSLSIAKSLNQSENITVRQVFSIVDPTSEGPLATPNATLETVKHLHLCGSKFCQHFDIGGSGFAVSEQTKYILYGSYMGCIILAMLIAIFFLEPLNLRLFGANGSVLQNTKAQLKSLAKFSINPKFLLLLPLLMYSSIQYGFVTAEITKAFVTCPLGIHMVGYTMICMGVCGSISSYASGLLTKIMGRMSLILIAATLNLGVLIFTTQWHPALDSLVPYFIVTGIWGISDGIWISQVNILMGVVFPEKYEEAFAGLRVIQGLGAAISFAYSNSLCMAYKIYIVGAICLVSVALYLAMEAILRRRTKSKIVMLKQTPV